MRRVWCRRLLLGQPLYLAIWGLAIWFNIPGPDCRAQQLPPTGVRPGDRPLPLPELEPPPSEPEVAPAPPAERPSKRRPLSKGIVVPIETIRLNYIDSAGAKTEPVFEENELRKAILNSYEGKALTTEDLIGLRNELTLYYYDRGYVNSGAVIPDQDVSDGSMTVTILQGELALEEIGISGLEHLRKRYVLDRIAFGVKKPLKVNPLQDQLQLLLRDPAIDRVQASLGPGVRPGESHLEIEVTEAPLFNFEIISNNDRPPSVGEFQGVLVARSRNVLGFSDPLQVAVSLTEGLKDGYFAYEVPVWSGLPLSGDALRLFVTGEITDADVVEEPFNELDIESETKSVEFGLRYPVYRGIGRLPWQIQDVKQTARRTPTSMEVWEQELSLGLSFVRRHSETFLLDRLFSFSPGVQDGESDISVLRFVQYGSLRSQEQVLAARSTFSFGVDAWGATINDTDSNPDSEFFAWLGQAQWGRRFPVADRNTQLFLRGAVQLATDPLLPIEQFAIGGLNTVRGYRRNQLVRDNGWVTSLEWRLPIFRVPLPGLSRTPEDGWILFAPFVDAGGGWNNDRPTPDPHTIYSAGAGVLWRPAPNVGAEVYYGYPLNDVREPEDKSLQDYGIYFNVRVGFNFGPEDVAQLF